MPRQSIVAKPLFFRSRTLFILIFAICAMALVMPTGAGKRTGADKAPFEFWEDDEEEARESSEAPGTERDEPEKDKAEREREEFEARDYLGRRQFRSEEEREMLLAASPDNGSKEIRFRAIN